MTSPFQPAIDELEKEVTNLESQLNGLLSTIGFLREKAGLPPRTPLGGENVGKPDINGHGNSGALNIQPDTYFGKKMSTAAREYLLARRAAGLSGPASPREIFEALKQGGFVFGSKDDANAKIVLATMLRKYSTIFQKIGVGSYGLKSWYGDVKKPRVPGQAPPPTDLPNDGLKGSDHGNDRTEDQMLENTVA